MDVAHERLRLVEGEREDAAPGERLWTVEDVCLFLGRKKTWVYEQCAARAKGGLPHVRLGGLRFVPSEVRAWVARGPVVVPSRKKAKG